MHGIYKYECGGKVIYVGKTDSSFESRIYAHSRDEKFIPYLEAGASISVYETRDEYEASFLETALINQHRPVLNVAKSAVTSVDICVTVPWFQWNGGWKQKRNPGEHRSIKGYSFTLQEENVKKLRELAKTHGVSASKMLDQLVDEYLEGLEISS